MAIDDQYEVLDEAGHKTGKILDLKTIHHQELWHEVANVWIMNTGGEILMQLRGPDMELSPSVWDVTIGTHLHPEEEPVMAGVRALKTGLGVEIASEEFKHLFNIMCANPMPNGTTHKVLGHVFMVQKDLDLSQLQFDPQKITQFSWVPLNTLMAEVGSTDSQAKYFPRANNYYPQLFTAFQSWM
ncbi:MAG TPA: NUDIX domain-containing protein [Candidatus Saccharimonadales bacterium]|nr:NUDIX domain-containing protein [Candidatus Saccharimonadales bacterium]